MVHTTFITRLFPVLNCSGIVIINQPTIRAPKQARRITETNSLISAPIRIGNAFKELTVVVPSPFWFGLFVLPYIRQLPIKGILVFNFTPQLHFSLSHFSQTAMFWVSFPSGLLNTCVFCTFLNQGLQEQSVSRPSEETTKLVSIMT